MRSLSLRGAGGGAVAVVAVAALIASTVAPGQATEINPTPNTGRWTIDVRGNGHGHGMSQYGARGAAIKGLTYQQILAFYYPHTALATVAATVLRVKVSGPSTAVTVLRQPGLTLHWSGGSYVIPATYNAASLFPSGTGLQLQGRVGASWKPIGGALPATAYFAITGKTVRYLPSSQKSIDYRGTVGAVRSGAGVLPINRVNLDDYTRGVVPREMPASWQTAAVRAQAVAARSYARYAAEHNSAQPYDICDTTACQVYGGAAQYGSNGQSNGIHEESASNAAVTATSNRVITYAGHTIFAEFSASNGGITSSGNQPYFVTRADPYDQAFSGDPYLSQTETGSAADVAAYYGLTSVSQLQINSREGGAVWGGLVATATVVGKRGANTVSIPTTGTALASALGLSYRYFHIRSFAPVGRVDAIRASTLHRYTIAGWTYDPTDTDALATVQVLVDRTTFNFVAGQPRVDVQQAHHLTSANHGFVGQVTVPGGTHRICVYGVGINKDRTLLKCSTVTVPTTPTGRVDTIGNNGGGYFRLTGWEYDPDRDAGPGRVHVYVDKLGYAFNAAGARPDVQAHEKLAGDAVGFNVLVPVRPGTHQICAYAINVPGTAGRNANLGCHTVRRG
ncbi:MAG: SpoIID/LytB domain protein [Frankiales bacterium]|nr:SpoIID/LytB domain protein [Frankiales bacterium]